MPAASSAPLASSAAPRPPSLDPRDILPLPRDVEASEAFREAALATAKLRLDDLGAVPSPLAERLRAEVDEDRVLAWLGGMMRACESDGAACKEGLIVERVRRETLEKTAALAGAIGSLRSASRLAVLGGRGLPVGGGVTGLLRRRRALQKPASPCAAPTPAEIAEEEKNLDDFVVFEQSGGALRGRALTAGERSDLAYFLVTIANERAKDPWAKAPGELSLDGLAVDREAQVAALSRGDLGAAREIGRARLARWGVVPGGKADVPRVYPAQVLPFVWDAAVVFELLGDMNEARWAYGVAWGTWSKRAPQGGLFAGVLPSRGMARTDGVAGLCRQIAWRHLQRGFTPVDPAEGPGELAALGLDVARLYRGGLLTEHREVLADDTKMAFLSADQRKKTAARVERMGNESFDDRGRLLQGQVEMLGRAAIPALLDRASGKAPGNAERALGILGSLLRQPDAGDPCSASFEPARPGATERSVRSLNETCATRLAPAELASIIAAIGKLVSHREHFVRYSAAQALGEIETDPDSPALRGFLKDTFHERRAPPGQQRLVALAAEAALDAVKQRSERNKP